MGQRTIALREDLYRRLRKEKGADESFSDVIQRLLESRQPSLLKYAGAWGPISEREYRRIRSRLDAIRHGGAVR